MAHIPTCPHRTSRRIVAAALALAVTAAAHAIASTAARSGPLATDTTPTSTDSVPTPADSIATPADSAFAATAAAADTLVYVDSTQFVYAGARRATLYGDLPLAETRIDPLRAAVTGGILGGIVVGLHLNMKSAWWRTGAQFHWKNDWNDVLQVDKCGHALAGYMMSYGMSEAMMATGISWDASTIGGTIAGLAYQTYVELQDGYSEAWGFSPSDMAANTFGAGLFLAQHYVPALQNLTPKYLYVPPAWIDAPRLSTTWIDNYNSSSFWLAVDVHNLLPESARDAWPSWLGLAVGYAVRIDEATRERSVMLALDYNLVKLLPDGGHVWNWLRQTLNTIKLPAPALVIGRTTRFRLLFPL